MFRPVSFFDFEYKQNISNVLILNSSQLPYAEFICVPDVCRSIQKILNSSQLPYAEFICVPDVCRSIQKKILRIFESKMSLTKEDFTSNEIIDAIQIGDTSVDIVGFVTKMQDNSQSDSKSKFRKFVVCNDHGREVQVIAWNDKIQMLDSVTEIGKIVLIGSLKSAMIRNANFNSGNVNFELQVKENTSIEVFESYNADDAAVDMIEEVSILEAYDNVGKTVKIEGIIKSEPSQYDYKNYKCMIGSITDCYYQLEMKIDFDCSNMNLQKGISVEAVGNIEQFKPGPAVIRIKKVEDLKILEDRSRVSFEELLGGYRIK